MSQSLQLSAIIFLIGIGSTHLNATEEKDKTVETSRTIAVRSSTPSMTSDNSDLTRRRAQNAALRNDIKTQEHKLADMDAMIKDLVAENWRLCQALASCAGDAEISSIMPLLQEASESGDEDH